ncbi:hypothetical protein NOR_08759 [Metarhizium rileyi]|uniref:Uncharacterized protein n=1 Tax=Metarhizium rileyi (strain RCEF 4871) TaxID=1649241 RepID=A0A166VNS9_METRR|nr:hypothetical protein NOR_08759 [Metarhizium rileyi RCEF 4871]
MIRVIKARTGYRCKDIRRIVVQNCDLGQYQWYLSTSGGCSDFTGEYLHSEGQR